MQIEVDNVKGFRDFLPPESLKREAIQKVIEKYFKLYGFMPIETPIVEFDELMKPSTLPIEDDDEAVSDRFKLKDRAGRNLGLRYEFTFQLSRIFKQNPNIKTPFRRYQIGPVFRDEPIAGDRFRQFVQCDADIIGDNSIRADAECLSLVSDILKELKIDCEIQINNRKLLNAIIESCEISSIKQVMRELDKLDKVGEDIVKANLRKYADSNKILTLFKLMEKPLEFFEENGFEGSSEIIELQSLCNKYGLKTKFNPYMIRGFGYYTGNVFEVKEPGKSSIAAGGRYDKSVGKYSNRDIPAVGISFGLERVSALAKIKPNSLPEVLIISIDELNESIKLLKKLRKYEISSILSEDKIGKSMEYANSYSIPYVIFIGEQEVEKKKYKIKDMKSGEEKLLSEKQIFSLFDKKIN